MKEDLLVKLTEIIFTYDPDAGNIHHLMSVHAYSALIGKMEGLNEHEQFILEASAYLHDIGVKISKEKYGNSHPEHQEAEGPAIAMELLKDFDISNEDKERICFIIGHHHTYSAIDGADFQILCEADYIVNLMEGYCKKESLPGIRKNLFKTRSGIKILNLMFNKD